MDPTSLESECLVDPTKLTAERWARGGYAI
jgi:hypothetical protein